MVTTHDRDPMSVKTRGILTGCEKTHDSVTLPPRDLRDGDQLVVTISRPKSGRRWKKSDRKTLQLRPSRRPCVAVAQMRRGEWPPLNRPLLIAAESLENTVAKRRSTCAGGSNTVGGGEGVRVYLGRVGVEERMYGKTSLACPDLYCLLGHGGVRAWSRRTVASPAGYRCANPEDSLADMTLSDRRFSRPSRCFRSQAGK